MGVDNAAFDPAERPQSDLVARQAISHTSACARQQGSSNNERESALASDLLKQRRVKVQVMGPDER